MRTEPSSLRPLTIAADIGGTFTDVVLTEPGGALWSTKVPTVPSAPDQGIGTGISALLRRSGRRAGDVGRVVHGTTLATNVILERRGAPVAFITTRGFGSMLELGRQARAQDERHDLAWRPLPPPVDRSHTYELDERLDATGAVIRPLSMDAVDAVIDEIAGHADLAAVAICLLHSSTDPAHEIAVARRCRERLAGRIVVASHEVLPQVREYDRAITTVLSATVAPIMSAYLLRLQHRLRDLGILAPLHVMSSSGDLMSADLAARQAISTIESGPAAGVIAAREVGRRVGRAHVLALDMGGTTAKASVIRDGSIAISPTFTVGGRTSTTGQRGGGLALSVPAIDLAEVGAGGGSIAWCDGDVLRVGPQSAGAAPGPACYGRGGTEATVTDANVVLGYLDATSLGVGAAADAVQIDVESARTAIETSIARPLGVGIDAAAWAVHQLANAAMAGALRVVTVQRGIDPRPLTLVVTGGAGPLHAAHIAEVLGIDTVLVPRGAGVGSAIGLVESELGLERTRAVRGTTTAMDPSALDSSCAELAAAAAHELDVALDDPGVRVERRADVRARGQIHEVSLPISPDQISPATLVALEAAFREHQRTTFGIAESGPTEMVAVRVRVVVPAARTALDGSRPTLQPEPTAARSTRRIHLAEGTRDATVLPWEAGDLTAPVAGPLLITAADTTALVPDAWEATRTRSGDLLLRRSR